MKIIVINTTDTRGGAAIATRRLYSALEKQHGIEYKLLVGDQCGCDKHVQPTRSKLQWLFEKLLDRLSRAFGIQYLWFPFSGRAILSAAKTFKPDIIHLQNIHGGFFPLQILPGLSRIAPLIWTLHDMWSFLGSAAHAFGDISWQLMQPGPSEHCIPPAIGLPTGHWLMRRKRQIYRDAQITFVCPSRWIQKLALQSPIFHGREVHFIPNGINTEIFTPGSKTRAREFLNLPKDGRILLFCNGGLPGNPWNGEKDLEQILQSLSKLNSTPLYLVYLGTPPRNRQFKDISGAHFPGWIPSEELLAHYYRAADVLLHPSRADNFPNVLLEASACGLPTVTYDVGGCSEIVVHQKGGEVISFNDLQGFITATNALLQLGNAEQMERGAACRKHVHQHFSLEKIADRYLQLFRANERGFPE